MTEEEKNPVDRYLTALNEDNLYSAIRAWEDISRNYILGQEPGLEHRVAYDRDSQEIQRFPTIPITDVVKEYNRIKAEADLDDPENDQDNALDMLDGFLESELQYFSTKTKTFYEQEGQLFVMDEGRTRRGDSHQIRPVDTVTDELSLEEIVQMYEFATDFDVRWRILDDDDKWTELARELYQQDHRGGVEILSDGESTYAFDRVEREFTELDEIPGGEEEDEEETVFDDLLEETTDGEAKSPDDED